MVNITDENYKSVVNSDKLVIIDFYAEWCGPCKMIAPILEKVEQVNTGLVIGKANVDDVIETSKINNIRNVPTLLFFKNGEVVGKIVGSTTQSAIQSKIAELS